MQAQQRSLVIVCLSIVVVATTSIAGRQPGLLPATTDASHSVVITVVVVVVAGHCKQSRRRDVLHARAHTHLRPADCALVPQALQLSAVEHALRLPDAASPAQLRHTQALRQDHQGGDQEPRPRRRVRPAHVGQVSERLSAQHDRLLRSGALRARHCQELARRVVRRPTQGEVRQRQRLANIRLSAAAATTTTTAAAADVDGGQLVALAQPRLDQTTAAAAADVQWRQLLPAHVQLLERRVIEWRRGGEQQQQRHDRRARRRRLDDGERVRPGQSLVVLPARLHVLAHRRVHRQAQRLHTHTQQSFAAHTRAHRASALRVQGRARRGATHTRHILDQVHLHLIIIIVVLIVCDRRRLCASCVD